ncbi:transposase [Microbulbifer sp. SSSA005]|uniref:transposase n=1 Tax=Microbulbifer sp. SSSA005 TaxID=3243378 RepID=UPI004039CC0E
MLYSTDTELDAMTLVAYYKSRFQIEFLFRDAKQHTGLANCQSIRKEAINMHVNASLVALNLLKIEDRNAKPMDEATAISIAS